MLGLIALKGKVVTADALHCNRCTVAAITQGGGGDYCLALKANQVSSCPAPGPVSARFCQTIRSRMGTVVFPDAPFKFFLTADLRTRALRRRTELLASHGTAESLDEVERDVAERDARDSTREAAPLRQADDATAVDTSGLTLDQVVERVLAHIRS